MKKLFSSIKFNLRAKVLIFTLSIIVILLITSHLATNTLVANNLQAQLEKRADLAIENLSEWLSARKEQVSSTAQILADTDWLKNDVDWFVPNWLGYDLEKTLGRGEPELLMVENIKAEEKWTYLIIDDPLRHGADLPRRASTLPEQRWSGGITEVVPDGDRLLLTVGIPIRKDIEVLGLLTLGTAIDQTAILDIRYASGSDELSIVKDGKIMLTTVAEEIKTGLQEAFPKEVDQERSYHFKVGEVEYLTRVQPLRSATGDIVAYLVVHFSDEESRKLLAGISNALNLIALGAFLLFSLLSIVFSGGVTTQLNRLVDYVTALGEGRDKEQIEVNSKDEVGVLARAFEELRVKLRHRTAELVRSERLASMGQIAAGVAHEINNPLGIVLGFTQELLVARNESDPDTEALKVIEQETERCAKVVKDLLNLARTGEPKRKPLDLRSLLDKTLKLFTIHLRNAEISVEANYNEVPLVLGDEQQLQQVFMNVIINSIHAMDGGGKLSISLSSSVAKEGGELFRWVATRIEDTGCGISAEELKHIFDPFFTTKKGKGSGLGLFIVHRLVDAHGGKVNIDSASGRGTVCTITLPAADRKEIDN